MDTAATGFFCLQVQILLLLPYHDKRRLHRWLWYLIQSQRFKYLFVQEILLFGKAGGHVSQYHHRIKWLDQYR